jgi:D-threo-aldose 1-dehydrogenase
MSEKLPLVQVGQTDLKVSRIGLGTAHVGKSTDEHGVAIIQKALELGINFLDTAPLYKTERYLGLALAGVPRDSYVLATKVGRLPDGQGGFTFNYSRDDVLRSIENSLNTLKIDRIDILHIHDPDNHYQQALDEAFPTLAELRSQGVIKAVGDALELFRQKKISVFPGGVYNSGILATGATANATYNYRLAPPEMMDKARRLEAVCAKHNVPLNAAAVQFVNTHPAVTSLIIGANQVEQVEENLKALYVPIPAAFWDDIREAGLIEAGAPTPKGHVQ